MNLFEKFEEVLSSDILKSFDKLYEERSGDYGKAITGIYYTMVAGLIRRSNSAMSTNMMINQIKKNYSEQVQSFDFSKTGNKDKDILEMVNKGQSSISQIFPAFKSPLLNLISTYAGTGKQQTTGFTGYITSYIIQKLGNMLFEDKVSPEDLIYYLQQHREVLFDKAPKDLMDKMIPALGLQEISTMRVAAPKKASSKKTPSKSMEVSQNAEFEIEAEESSNGAYEQSNSSNRWLFLVLALAVLGVLSYVVYDNREVLFGETEGEVAEAVAIENEVLVDSVAIDSSVVQSVENQGAGLPIAELKDVNKPLDTIFELPMFSFSGTAVDLSAEQLVLAKPLADLMKSNSRMQLQILGNNGGSKDNIALKRAFSLKKYLLDQGVENIRIDAASSDFNSNNLQVKVISR